MKSINIQQEVLRVLAVGSSESLNAHPAGSGAPLKPVTAGAMG